MNYASLRRIACPHCGGECWTDWFQCPACGKELRAARPPAGRSDKTTLFEIRGQRAVVLLGGLIALASLAYAATRLVMK